MTDRPQAEVQTSGGRVQTIGSSADVLRRGCEALNAIGSLLRHVAEASPDRPQLWLDVRDLEGIVVRLTAAEQFAWDPQFARGMMTGQDLAILDMLIERQSVGDGAIHPSPTDIAAVEQLRNLVLRLDAPGLGAATTAASLGDEIDATHQQWHDAYRRGDADAAIALLTDDYCLWAPGREPIFVVDLEPRLRAAFAAYDCDPAFERIELLAAYDLAIDIGWDIQRLTPRAGGEQSTQRQRVCVVLRRGTDGAWRYARGMVQPGPT